MSVFLFFLLTGWAFLGFSLAEGGKPHWPDAMLLGGFGVIGAVLAFAMAFACLRLSTPLIEEEEVAGGIRRYRKHTWIRHMEGVCDLCSQPNTGAEDARIVLSCKHVLHARCFANCLGPDGALCPVAGCGRRVFSFEESTLIRDDGDAELVATAETDAQPGVTGPIH